MATIETTFSAESPPSKQLIVLIEPGGFWIVDFLMLSLGLSGTIILAIGVVKCSLAEKFP